MNSITKEGKLTGPGVVGTSRSGVERAVARAFFPSLSNNCAGKQVLTQACPPQYTSETDDMNLINNEMTISELDTDALNSHSLPIRKRKLKKGGKRSLPVSPGKSGDLITKRKHRTALKIPLRLGDRSPSTIEEFQVLIFGRSHD